MAYFPWLRSRKDVERGYGVLKIKFLVLTYPITFHHRGDIYYLVLATILLHNMMVEELVENDKVEDGSMYNTIDPNDDCEYITEDEDDDRSGGCEKGTLDRQEKFKIVHRR